MHPETLFNASCKLTMVGWALLVVPPRWRWSQRVVSAIIPLTLAIVYLVLLVLYFATSPGALAHSHRSRSFFRIPGSWPATSSSGHHLPRLFTAEESQ